MPSMEMFSFANEYKQKGEMQHHKRSIYILIEGTFEKWLNF